MLSIRKVFGAAAIALAASGAGAATFTNSASISVPDSGAASPFPSTVLVSGVDVVGTVTVDLFGLSHTFPDDLYIVLEGPSGLNVVLMSDSGGAGAAGPIDITFDDAAAGPIPDDGPLTAGSYQVSQAGNVETLPSPGPTTSFGDDLSLFSGIAGNGTWSLYVYDDIVGDSGSIAGGFALNFSGSDAVVPVPPAALLLLTGFAAIPAIRRFA